MVTRVLFGLSFRGRTLHTKFVYVISFFLYVGTSSYQMTWNVSVTATFFFLRTFSPEPIPWQRRTSSFQYDSSQIFWYLGWCRSQRYSRESPVSELRTNMDGAVTGVDQRASKALGKYCWDTWEGVNVRDCCNWDHMCRAIIGCAFCVWDLVRRAMG